MIISVTNPTDFVDCSNAIHKMWSCSFWTLPQEVVGYHREPHHFREEKSTKELTAPQHTRFILPPIHPDKIHRCAAWAVFFFMGNVPWKFHKPTGRDTDFSSTPLQNRGRNFVRANRRFYIRAVTLYLFLRLNNSETIVRNVFWAKR